MDPGGAGQHGVVCFTGALPQGEEPQVMLLQSHWNRYRVAVDGTEIFAVDGGRRERPPISAAMGCAWAEGADKDLQQLLRQADDSMYGTKKKMKERGT